MRFRPGRMATRERTSHFNDNHGIIRTDCSDHANGTS
jgi:hypothetical protein